MKTDIQNLIESGEFEKVDEPMSDWNEKDLELIHQETTYENIESQNLTQQNCEEIEDQDDPEDSDASSLVKSEISEQEDLQEIDEDDINEGSDIEDSNG